MKKNLFTCLLFLLVLSGNADAASNDCMIPLAEKSLTTWVDEALFCLEGKSQLEKRGSLHTLSHTVLKHVEEKQHNQATQNAISALIWIIYHQTDNGDFTLAFGTEEEVFKLMEKTKENPYSKAKLLLPLASVWVEFNVKDHSYALMEKLVKLLPEIPQRSRDHEAAQKMVLVSIMDLLNRAGMDQLYDETKSKFSHLLE